MGLDGGIRKDMMPSCYLLCTQLLEAHRYEQHSHKIAYIEAIVKVRYNQYYGIVL